nr:hypothetical protein [Candidatus Sigynarchaeota archaeon]
MNPSLKRVFAFLCLIYGFLTMYILLLVFSENFREGIIDFLSFFSILDPALGMLWVFVFMAIGNCTNIPIGIPAVYVFAKSTLGPTFWPMLALFALSAGFGAATGGLAIYAIGRGAGHKWHDRKGVQNLEYLAQLITQRRALAPLLVYVFALTPLPDQLLMIPLGISRYPIKKIYLPSALGKSTFAFFIAIGATIFNETSAGITISSLIQEAFVLALILTLLVFCIMVNWENVI